MTELEKPSEEPVVCPYTNLPGCSALPRTLWKTVLEAVVNLRRPGALQVNELLFLTSPFTQKEIPDVPGQ